MEVFQQEVLKRLPFSERDAATTLLIEAKGARGALASVGAQTPPDEGALMRAAQVLKEVFSAKQINAALLSQTKRALKQLHDAGSKLMSRRDVNVRAAESFDRVMLPARYSASSRAIIIAGPLLHRYGKDAGEEQVEEMVRSLGLGDPVKPAPAPDEPPSESRTKEEMEVLQEQLSDPEAEIDPSELGRRVAAVAAGAVEHNLEDVLEKLRFALYEVGAPPVARFAFLAALPISQGYATMWSELLAGEDENVLLALKTYLDSEEKQLLKQLVPDLLDLID